MNIQKFFSKSPDQPRGLPNLLFSGYWGSLQVVKRTGREAATHLNLRHRLSMSGATPLFPLYAFMVWTGKALPLYPNFINGSRKPQNLQWLPFLKPRITWNKSMHVFDFTYPLMWLYLATAGLSLV